MKRLKIAAGVAISVVLIGLLLWNVDLPELGRQLRRTHWGWALVAAALAVVGLWLRARRWRYLFPPGSEPPSLVAATMIGYMVNNVLPLRAGEVVRVYVVARRWHQGFWTALATLVVERVLDSLAIVLVLAMLVVLQPVPAVFRWAAGTMLAVDLIAVALLVLFAVVPARCGRVLDRLTRRWPGLGGRLSQVFERFVLGLDGIRTARHLLPLLLWTILVWLAPALAAWTMLRAAGLELPFTAAWAVLAFVGLGVSIPSAPGYVGVFHYAAVLALAMFDVPRGPAVGYAIVFHASQIIPVTLAGWLMLLREHVSLGEATRARPLELDAGAPPPS